VIDRSVYRSKLYGGSSRGGHRGHNCSPKLFPFLSKDGVLDAQQLKVKSGVRHGWTQSSREPNGTIGILTFSRTEQAITAEELNEIEVKLNWLTHAAHRLISGLIIPDQLLDATCKLSQREQEVLRWTSEGKTCKETGWILEITERTVNFHVNNAMTKLRASNKTHAAVKAALLGMLF
jgi:LuxR family transcriptional regulator, quorum-sensing system regulator SolR